MTIWNKPCSELRKFHNVIIKVCDWSRSWVNFYPPPSLKTSIFKFRINVMYPSSLFHFIFFRSFHIEIILASSFPSIQIYYSQPFDPMQLSAILCRITKWLNSCPSPPSITDTYKHQSNCNINPVDIPANYVLMSWEHFGRSQLPSIPSPT